MTEPGRIGLRLSNNKSFHNLLLKRIKHTNHDLMEKLKKNFYKLFQKLHVKSDFFNGKANEVKKIRRM